jgi:hypothetical protein
VRVSHEWSRASAVFDDERLVSLAGLAPVMGLAERAGLSELIAERVGFKSTRVASAGVNPAGKLTSIIAGMAAGAQCIEDLGVIRSGGMSRMFTGVYAPATLGQLLREFSHGHGLQLGSVLRAHLVNLVGRSDLLPGIAVRAFVDIDSLLRPVYGHAKQGASYGHTKIAGKQVLRKGLSPLVTTISTPAGAPVIAGIRLRAGKAGSGRGAASMVTEAIRLARAAGAAGQVLVRGDSAYGNSKVIAACRRHGARFSLVLTKTRQVQAAIDTIDRDAWTPVNYPGSVTDPDTGALISDAQVAEVEFTAFASTKHPITARLIVRRVRRRNPTAAARGEQDELFAVHRYHAVFTDNPQPMLDAEATHRDHAIVEQVIADLKDSALAHLPSGHFNANGAWLVCAAIALDLTRAAGALASRFHARARTATIRTQLINTPARLGPLRPAVHRGLAGPHGVRVGMPRAGRGRLEIPSAWPACVDLLRCGLTVRLVGHRGAVPCQAGTSRGRAA